MKKNYVVDSNVLVHDPQAIFKFEDNNLIIPIYVIEEIDRFKRETTERGRNAREITRLLDALREKHGSLAQPIPTPGGGTLQVYCPEERPRLKMSLDQNSADSTIVQTVIDLRDQSKESLPTIFVTMDVNLRIRADALGLPTQTYENQSIEPEELDRGIVDVTVTAAQFDEFFKRGQLPLEGPHLFPNVCLMLRHEADENRTALARYHAEDSLAHKLHVPRDGLMSVRPRNKEQSFALDLLLDSRVKLVTLIGMAGTGKTLLALAAGLTQTVLDGSYARLLVSRPIVPMGKDLGYLPGDIREKMGPWMKPIFDNLEFLLLGAGRRRGVPDVEALMEGGQIEIEPLTYIRGRSLPNQYVIVDEAQNLTPHEVKTVITRCAEGTKIVLTGDPFQIDNPYVDSASNGLSIVANRLKGESLAGHIVLSKGERSELANLAAHKL